MLSTLFLMGIASPAGATTYAYFPPEIVWDPQPCGAVSMFDDQGDEPKAPGEIDIVGDKKHPAAYFVDGDGSFFLRMRLDEDPSGKVGPLESLVWAVMFDTDNVPSSFEAAVRYDGATSMASAYTNLTMDTPSDFREAPDEPAVATQGFGKTLRVITAPGSSFGGDPDYFLDIRMPWPFLAQVGVTSFPPDSLVIGTSNQLTGRLDGDIVCEMGPGPGETGDTGAPGPTGDTGSAADFLLEGGGGCSTLPAAYWAPWLVVGLALVGARIRR